MLPIIEGSTSPKPLQDLSKTSPRLLQNLSKPLQNLSKTSPRLLQNLSKTSPRPLKTSPKPLKTSPKPLQNLAFCGTILASSVWGNYKILFVLQDCHLTGECSHCFRGPWDPQRKHYLHAPQQAAGKQMTVGESFCNNLGFHQTPFTKSSLVYQTSRWHSATNKLNIFWL